MPPCGRRPVPASSRSVAILLPRSLPPPAAHRPMARKIAAKTVRTTTSIEKAVPAAVITGRRTAVVAHLVTGEDIKSALISSDDDLDVEFEGDDPRDQHATVTTDENGMLTWALVLETAFAHASWRLTLTKLGDPEGPADAEGVTDAQGRAVPSAIKTF